MKALILAAVLHVDPDPSQTDEAFEALADVAQRHRVRVYRDGRIRPLVPQTGASS